MSLRDLKSIEERKAFVSKQLKISLVSVGVYPPGLRQAEKGNCENMIGAVHIPVGIAGPLKVCGQYANGDFFIPLATSEAALVASVARGCKSISASGGAYVHSEVVGVTRGSIFKTTSLKESIFLKEWLEKHIVSLRKIASLSSSHTKLQTIFVQVVGTNVYVRFSYDTADAMGMNMATIVTDAVANFIILQTKAKLLSLAGNNDIDKKPAWLNFILGRGRKVWAEASLSASVISRVLKTTPRRIHEVSIEKCLKGSAISGSLGFNAHFANVIAAMFIATGQDAAHIVEGSLGITSTEIYNGKLLISIMLPDLLVGVVGGGTILPAQQEILSLLAITARGKGEGASKFAEIVAAAVLAGEISLLAALAEGNLATSHQRLRRTTI